MMYEDEREVEKESRRTTNDTCKIIIVVTVCASFLINSIMFGWSKTRFSADDEVKMKQATISDDVKALNCKNSNGKPIVNMDNEFLRCEYN